MCAANIGGGEILTVGVNMSVAEISRIAIGNCQGQGARPYQEDSFGFSSIDSAITSENGFTAVVADGMGGLQESNLVSSMLVNYMVKAPFNADSSVPLRNQFYDCVVKTNSASNTSGGGSTLVAVYCCKKGVYWCSVGDSRLYLWRDGKIFRVTEDMDYERDLFRDVHDDVISYEEASSNPKKSALVQYIGMPGDPVPECSVRPFQPKNGDKFLICSDGVYNAMDDGELAAVLGNPAQEAANAIHSTITRKNYETQDNFTAIVLEFLR